MKNLFDLSSLRGKITSAYIALVISTLTLGVIAFSGLRFLERQITEGEVVSDLRNAVLEMRREEKNLLLYADIDALAKADEQAALSFNMLQRYSPLLKTILDEIDPLELIQILTRYRSSLGRWNEGSAEAREAAQEQIRMLGHRIHISVETLSYQERRMLEEAVRESQWFLFFSLF